MTDRTHNRVLIIGATGTVGSEVLNAAHRVGVACRVLLRAPERAPEMPADVEVCKGDLADLVAVERALEGVSGAFYVSPHVDNEEEIAAQFTAACLKRSIRMVFVGVHADGANRFSRWLQRGAYGALMPHYKGKLRLSEKVRRSGADVVMLGPTNFFQNDELTRDSVLKDRRYLHPVGRKGINRIDARDIGDAAVRALTDRSVSPGVYPLFGPNSLSGPECAAIWSSVMGETVEYVEDDNDWQAMVSVALSGRKRDDILKTYRNLRKFKLPTTSNDIARTVAFLGHPPRSYREYVTATYSEWQRDAAGVQTAAGRVPERAAQ